MELIIYTLGFHRMKICGGVIVAMIVIGLTLSCRTNSSEPEAASRKLEIGESPQGVARSTEDPECLDSSEYGPVTLSQEARVKAEFDIAEALFRYLFEHNFAIPRQNIAAYYLAFGNQGEDPPIAFMKRFEDHQPAVYRQSELEAFDAGDELFEDSDPLRPRVTVPGLSLWVKDIEWKSDVLVSAYGEYYEGPLRAAGGVYCVRNVAGVWMVTELKPLWIS